ncbi:hypothetical protein L6164_032805 [Bauhinia variegata]|uniref:Uncharacterized protein n=1 Tax=Bauhinia variegata TaxID=167791 RepID=A0ACB9KPU2_BAUVA|nr:hypothetical protein L6164_032805 [Bauhinia variegata]
MATVGFCGLRPLLFRRNKCALEALRGTNMAMKPSKAEKESNREQIECSFVGADQLILMLEVQKKIVAFRDVLDLAPCNCSASLREMVIKTLEDLQRLYPNIISRKKISETAEKSTNKGLVCFCESLKALGESWMMNNDWTNKLELPSCKDTSNMEELGETVLLTLDSLIKLAIQKFDVMDEDEKKKDFSPRSSSFRKYILGFSSFSDSNFSCSSSPVTPTSVLPELVKYAARAGDSPRASCTSPLLQSLRVQAVGKLNPIDIKILNFHMSPDSPHKEIQFSKIEGEPRTDMELDGKSSNAEKEKDLVFNLDSTEELCSGAHKETAISQAVTEAGLPPSPTPVETHHLLQQQQSPVSLPSSSQIPSTASHPSLSLTPLPPLPPPSAPSTQVPPSPPPETSTPNLPSPPPSMMLQNAVPLPPSVPMPPVLQTKAFPPLPLPSLAPQLQQNVAASVVCPPPPPPPLPHCSGSLAGAAAPPPPSPMPFKAGPGPAPPPPMARGNGVAAPPPPPLGGRCLRAKATTKLKRSTHLGNLYRSLKGKVEGSTLNGKSSGGRKSFVGASSGGKQGMADALAEMTKRSSYFQQIEEDVQKYSKKITELRPAITNFKTKEMTELVKFHKDVESVLEKLTDESQVLSRFEGFPTKKLEAIRMAAALYNKLDSMLIELQNWKIVPPLGQLLDRVERHFNKIKIQVDALERTKDEESKKFKSHNIEFDFHVLVRIKEAMVDVSSNCMELALQERRENASKREPGSKSDGKPNGCGKMLWRAFQFAFRVYTFAGGHDDRADKLTRELAHEIENDPHTT